MKPLSKSVQYSQPNFYRFSEDSILLSKTVTKFIKDNNLNPKSGIDMCCGCGVIGIEVAKEFPDLRMSFLELQDEFIPYLKENIEKFNLKDPRIYNVDLITFSADKKFDLITLNPPYFDKVSSRLSSDKNKLICRSILKDDAFKIIKSCELSIKKGGYMFIVRPKDSSMWDEVINNSHFKIIDRINSGKVLVLILKNE